MSASALTWPLGMRRVVAGLLHDAVAAAMAAGTIGVSAVPAFTVFEPPDPELGDLASNLPLAIAAATRVAPHEAARVLIDATVGDARREWLDEISVGGPGFLNVRFAEAYWRYALPAIARDLSPSGAAPDGGQDVVVPSDGGSPIRLKGAEPATARSLLWPVRVVAVIDAVERLSRLVGHRDGTGTPISGRASDAVQTTSGAVADVGGIRRAAEVLSSSERTWVCADGRYNGPMPGVVLCAPGGSQRVLRIEAAHLDRSRTASAAEAGWESYLGEFAPEVLRYFLLRERREIPLVFDRRTASTPTTENPLVYLRCALRRLEDARIDDPAVSLPPGALVRPSATVDALVRAIASWPDAVEAADRAADPAIVVRALEGLAAAFHRDYNLHGWARRSVGSSAWAASVYGTVARVLRQGMWLTGITPCGPGR